MNPTDFATPAHLIADPARASILSTLLDGRALPAGELARSAGVTAQTASSHLAKLLDGGLLAVETSGRHRYYRLSGPHVAEALERLAFVRPTPSRAAVPNRRADALRLCRSCYDHLAGQVGVALADGLQRRHLICEEGDKHYAVTPAGTAWLAGQGLAPDRLRPGRRAVARRCLDWTERRHHVAGPLGTALMDLLCRKRWLLQEAGSRVVQVTPQGWIGLAAEFEIRQADLAGRGDRPTRP